MTPYHERRLQRSITAKADFLASFDRCADRQRAVLQAYVEANRDTDFGRAHGFNRVDGVDAFRRAVPLRSYAALSPWIERACRGEAAVLTAEAPLLFFSSSGSTGAQKSIPITPTFLRDTFIPFTYASMGNFFQQFPETALRDDATLNLKWDPLLDLGQTASGRPYLGASQVDYGKLFAEDAAAEPGTRAPWAAPPREIREHLDRIYYRVRLAVGHDLRAIVGINPAVIAGLAQWIGRWASRLAEELRAGTVLGRAALPPDPDGAAWIERCAAHFGQLAPQHLWPRLEAIFCWTGSAASVYLPSVRAQFGPQAQLVTAPLAASEGPIAISIDRHPTAGALAVPFVFLEFVDADVEATSDAPTRLAHELQIGGEYQVVLTNAAGLYRYALGDVVRVIDRVGEVPRVEYLGRKRALAGSGFQIGEWRLPDALQAALRASGLRCRNFRFQTQREAMTRVELTIEPLERWSDDDRATLARAVDGELRRLSDDYRQRRDAGAVQLPAIRSVEPGAFLAEWEGRVRAGSRPAQVKDLVSRSDEGAAAP